MSVVESVIAELVETAVKFGFRENKKNSHSITKKLLGRLVSLMRQTGYINATFFQNCLKSY